MSFNEKLIKLRKEKGLSQEELGYELNVSRQSVSKWESNQSNPDIEKIKELSKFFNVSIDYLLNDDIVEPNPQQIKQKKNKKIIISLSIILLIYLITVIYKFIGLTIFYNVANSFSEKNYWMNISYDSNIQTSDAGPFGERDISRDNNMYIESIYTKNNEMDSSMPQTLTYINYDKNIAYSLNYDIDTKKYNYSKLDIDINEYFENNHVKDETINTLPENRLLFSLNPLNFVSIKNKYIKSIYFIDGNKITNTNYYDEVGLIEFINETSSFNNYSITYSYDYVQDHFGDRIIDPTEDEDFKDKIVYNN